MSTDTQPVETEDADDLQARLMRMLDTVRLEKARPVQEEAQETGKKSCPHCGSETPWGSSSWCLDCGYYPKLGRAVTPVEAAEVEAEFSQEKFQWAVTLAGGLLMLTLLCAVVRIAFPDPGIRTSWAICQLLLGITLFCLAQVHAYLIAAESCGTLCVTSLIFDPVKLWEPVFKSLPKTQRTVYMGGWSLGLILLAVLVVGIDFNSLFGPPRKAKKGPSAMKYMMQMIGAAGNAQTAFANNAGEEAVEEEPEAPNVAAELANGVGVGGNSNMSMEEAMNSFAGDAGVNELAGGAGNGNGGGKAGGDFKLDGASGIGAVGDVPGGDDLGSNPEVPAAGELSGNGEPPAREDSRDNENSGGKQPNEEPAVAPNVEQNAAENRDPAAQPAPPKGEEKPVADPEKNSAAVVTPPQPEPEKTVARAPEEAPAKAPEAKPADANAAANVPKNAAPEAVEAPLTSKGEVRQDRSEFFIFGYSTNASGEMRSVLLAEVKNNRVRFAGRLSVEEMGAARQRDLQRLLDQHLSRGPALQVPYNARWVQPVVMCTVAHLGWGAGGEPREGFIVSVTDLSGGK